MNIILVTLGSAGDVHPFVGLALALRGRGHRVVLVTSGYFQELAQRAGLHLEPTNTRKEFEKTTCDPDLWHPTRGFRVVLAAVMKDNRRIYDAIQRLYVPGETVVVASSLGFAARLAQEKLGIPTATVHLSPAILRTVHDTPKLPGLIHGRWVPKWGQRLAYWLADALVIDRIAGPPVNQMRAELGLPPVKGILRDWWHSPQLVIGMWPPWFAAMQPDWPQQVRLSGFPLWDESALAELPPDLGDFLDAGEAPIVFTPGSAMVHAREFFHASAETCRISGWRGLLLSPHHENLPAELPPQVKHFDYAPFSQLLPRCAALVHHGGIGTTAQALAAGIPQLVMPMSHDQFDNARRIEKLDCGQTIPRHKYRAGRVARALESLLADDDLRQRARDVARKFIGVDAISGACDLIEKHFNISRPTPRAVAAASR